MPQVFGPASNTVARASLLGLLLLVVAGFLVLGIWIRSPYATGVGVQVPQPVMFSHKHHAGDDGIDCRYCHTSVETSAFAGIPSTGTCMNCHRQLWRESRMLAPVIASWETGRPLVWNRVHNLPDFVYFDHGIHVAKGVGCATCHGRVDRMPLVRQVASLRMTWCLECHREPERFLRPREEVFNMAWMPPDDRGALGRRLAEAYDVRRLTDCYTCHR